MASTDTEADFIVKAYGTAMKAQFQTFVSNLDPTAPAPPANPAAIFSHGIALCRGARDFALTITTTRPSTFESDLDLMQEAFGEFLANLVKMLINTPVGPLAPAPQAEYRRMYALGKDALGRAVALVLV